MGRGNGGSELRLWPLVRKGGVSLFARCRCCNSTMVVSFAWMHTPARRFIWSVIIPALIVAGQLRPGEGIPGWPTYNSKVFQGGLDHVIVHGGKASYRMWADSSPMIQLAGAVRQSVKGDKYRDKRLRFSAYLRTESPEGLQLQLDLWGHSDQHAEMQLNSTTGWRQYQLVLDVPHDCLAINFGFTVLKGTVWMDDVSLTTVGREVPMIFEVSATKRNIVSWQRPPAITALSQSTSILRIRRLRQDMRTSRTAATLPGMRSTTQPRSGARSGSKRLH